MLWLHYGDVGGELLLFVWWMTFLRKVLNHTAPWCLYCSAIYYLINVPYYSDPSIYSCSHFHCIFVFWLFLKLDNWYNFSRALVPYLLRTQLMKISPWRKCLKKKDRHLAVIPIFKSKLQHHISQLRGKGENNSSSPVIPMVKCTHEDIRQKKVSLCNVFHQYPGYCQL